MTTQRQTVVAGTVTGTCRCCPTPQPLTSDPQLEPSRRCCPSSHLTYLDRGDGIFEPDGEHLPLDLAPVVGTTEDLLSDRPTRTAEKTRIQLERATFAGEATT